MMNTLKLVNISKIIKGNKVLSNINLSFESKKIYGFVGINGSGKTMLFRVISGLVQPTEGEVIYNSQKLHKDISTIPSLGVVIENVGLYTEFTGFQNLKFLAGIRKVINDDDIRNTILRVGLNPDDKRTVKKYSLGMKQRIVLAQALMEKPDLILLDEPTNALDEDGINLIRQILTEEKERGAIILIASHNKEDIELLCDEVHHIKDGIIL